MDGLHYSDLKSVAERLRWLRSQKGLRQEEVAEIAGVSISVYKKMECGNVQHIAPKAVQRLGSYYGVPEEDFMDEFNQFLFAGQGRRILAYRNRLGMNRKEFGEYLGIPQRSLYDWEKEEKRISYQCWEKYFKDRA